MKDTLRPRNLRWDIYIKTKGLLQTRHATDPFYCFESGHFENADNLFASDVSEFVLCYRGILDYSGKQP
jgi:hypothetical protein